ncbi:MAG: hypothetical protein A2014_10330 [Spirochaetes bacterium GWF1_49_6]|nr:MAG: hypothetical protein A2014_10330 [Spirochaetes bacterium GWF1_49_6]
MKRLCLMMMFSVLAGMGYAKDSTLTDYFLMLPDGYFTGVNISDYNLQENLLNGVKWGGVDNIDDIVLDPKNGFMKVTSKKDNPDEVNFTAYLCYFLKADKSKVFGFALNVSGYCYDYTTNAFLTFDSDGGISDLTALAMPPIDFKTFWGDAPLPDKKYQHYHLVYTLPQYGTTWQIAIEADQSPDCDFDVKLWDEYYKVMAKVKYKKIDIEWDKAHGIFNIGKKYEK